MNAHRKALSMMTFENIHAALAQRLPEVEKEASHIQACYGDPRVERKLFYFCAFNQILWNMLECDRPDEELLFRAFRFMEDMAMCPDADVRELLQVTILEKLWDETFVLRRAEQRMLPYTKRASDNILGYYYR
ncbi:hypothetical protein LJC07_08545, partial [Christensenellaceae bacterium OttesenSCG-928-L17]|nr:hypothetical protein [Christensenellaceae bacterium OttesenSCG-928-L17]